jgi:hypothetical protein
VNWKRIAKYYFFYLPKVILIRFIPFLFLSDEEMNGEYFHMSLPELLDFCTSEAQMWAKAY